MSFAGALLWPHAIWEEMQGDLASMQLFAPRRQKPGHLRAFIIGAGRP
jgi:hypothetical protein